MSAAVWVLTPYAAAVHEPVGVYSSQELAEAAKVVAETFSDGHHRLVIERFTLNAPNRRGVDCLRWDGWEVIGPGDEDVEAFEALSKIGEFG